MKILIIDWTNLLFRSYHASSKMNMTNWEKPTWATYFALNSFRNMKEYIEFDNKVDKVIFTFDNRTSKISRKKIFDWYKANRDHSKVLPIFWQIDDFKEIIENTEHELFDEYWLEADDVCWILARELVEGWKYEDLEHIYLYSSDKDFYQFLNPMVTIIKAKHWWELVSYDYLDFDEDFEMTSEEYILYKAIMWDWSDNIINIKWFWSSWAIKILNRYWSLEKWYEDDEWWFILPKSIREFINESLTENEDQEWYDIKIPWFTVENEDWEEITTYESVKNLLNINHELVKINYDYSWVPDEEKNKTQNKIKNLFNKERNAEKLTELLEWLKIKRKNII